jgi:hypothetical protein
MRLEGTWGGYLPPPAWAWLAWWVLSNRDPRPLFFLFLTVFTTCNLL